MEYFLRIGLPIYFLLYFGIAFVLKSIIMYKRIGKNPIVLPNDDTAHGLLGFYFKVAMFGLLLYVIVFSVFPNIYDRILPIHSLDFRTAKVIGMILLMIALIWTIIAQNQMKDSWRIGIDNDSRTELVTNGLFKISRNPIYLGMVFSLLGLLLITPNFITLMYMILGYVFIQIQIRLEEDFLSEQHGKAFETFKQNTRRLI